MGQNTRLYQFTGSLTELGMVARKRPRLGQSAVSLVSRWAPQSRARLASRGAQMATAQEARPRSPEPELGLGGMGCGGGQGRHRPLDPLFLPAEPQLPRSAVVATLLILARSVTSLQGPFFICNLVPLRRSRQPSPQASIYMTGSSPAHPRILKGWDNPF